MGDIPKESPLASQKTHRTQSMNSTQALGTFEPQGKLAFSCSFLKGEVSATALNSLLDDYRRMQLRCS